jgi:hypothetical protein
MYIRNTTKAHKGKTHDNYLLVQSLSTPKGPRQKILCSLGSLVPAPREHWLNLAHRLRPGGSTFTRGGCWTAEMLVTGQIIETPWFGSRVASSGRQGAAPHTSARR